jgi:hypothetical protein
MSKPHGGVISLLLATLCMAALGACVTTEQRSVREELGRLLAVPQDGGAEATVQSASTTEGLANLSARAEQSAREAETQNPDAAVGLYTISTLAAWKDRQPVDARVAALATAGLRACERLPQKGASRPRDCSLLLAAPAFAAYDRDGQAYVELRRVREAAPDNLLPASRVVEAVTVFSDLRQAFDRLTLTLDRTAGWSVPEELRQRYADGRLEAYCLAQGLAGTLATAPEFNKPAQARSVRQSLDHMRATIRNSGRATTCQTA